MFIGYLGAFVLVAHAAYSSYEFHRLAGTAALPYDIVLELAVGVVLMVVSLLSLIRNHAKLSVVDDTVVVPDDRFLKPIAMREAMKEFHEVGVTDYDEYETRVDFLDVVKKRDEYAKWAESKGANESKDKEKP